MPSFFNDKNKQWYLFILDIIDTKLYRPPTVKEKKKAPKNICVLSFVNKGLEEINLSKIVRSQEVIDLLPEKLRSEEEIPMITYKLRNPIRNKIFNYKETVQSIKFENGEVSLDQYLCECSGSELCDSHHQHIITGDLRIVESGKLRSLLTKGPNYREPLSVNYSKCKTAITDAINSLIQQVTTKNSLTLDSLE